LKEGKRLIIAHELRDLSLERKTLYKRLSRVISDLRKASVPKELWQN